MDTGIFQVSDHVIIKSTNLKFNNTIGKIEEIFIEDGIRKYKYNEFYFPEKTYGIL